MTEEIPRWPTKAWYLDHAEMAIDLVGCPVCGVDKGRRCKRWQRKQHRHHGSQKGVHALRATLAVEVQTNRHTVGGTLRGLDQSVRYPGGYPSTTIP